MTGGIIVETKREGQRKAKRQRAHMNPKNKREKASPFVVYCLEGNYVT
jgi:hypothetical protein